LLFYFEDFFRAEPGERAGVCLDDAFEGHTEIFSEKFQKKFDFDICLGVVIARNLELIF
jgi:hypothetical protein